jgi:hypothetical protein
MPREGREGCVQSIVSGACADPGEDEQKQGMEQSKRRWQVLGGDALLAGTPGRVEWWRPARPHSQSQEQQISRRRARLVTTTTLISLHACFSCHRSLTPMSLLPAHS